MAQDNWWERDAVAPTTAPVTIPLGPRDPSKARAETREEARLRLAIDANQRAAAAAAASAANEAARIELARRQDAREEAKAGGPGGALTAEARAKLLSQKGSIPIAEATLKEIEDRYAQDFSATGIGALPEFLPGWLRPANKSLDDAGNSLLGPLAQAFGVTSGQSNTPLEVEQRFGPYLPKHNILDPANLARIERLKRAIAGQKASVYQQLGEPLPAAPPPSPADAPPPRLGPPVDYSGIGGDGPQIGIANGAVRQEYDPQLTAQLNRAIRVGLPYSQAMKLVPPGTPLVDPKTYAAAVQYARGHKEYKKSLAEITRGVRNTAWQRFASSPVAAALSGAGNAAVAGGSDEIAGRIAQAFGGDYEETRDKFDVGKKLLAAEHPVADLTGNVVGGLTGALGAAKIPGVMGALRAAPRLAPVAGDIAYGSTYGALENNEDRLTGAALGGATGLAAGALGRGAIRKIGNLVGGPEVQPAVQRLMDKGIIMSPAQRAAGNKTLLGTTRKRIDDALTSAPIVGDAITAQRGRQFDQLGRATLEEALSPIGVKPPANLTGNKLIEHANDQVSKAYDRALPGIQAQIDTPFIEGNNAVRASVQTLPDQQRQMFDTIYSKAVKPFIPDDGVLTGKALQDIKRGLDKQIMRLGKTDNPADEYLADELQNLRGVFFDWAERAAPEKVGEFRAANAAFANMVRVNRAAAAAKKDGVFTPDQLLGAIKANSSDAQFASGGLPMQQLGQDAQQILPSRLPESGTVPRSLINIAGGASALGGSAAVPAVSPFMALPLAKAAVHAPGVDKMLQAIALRRGAALARAGRAIRQRQRLGGAVAVPLAVENATVQR